MVGGSVLYYDDDHLSAHGSRRLRPSLVEAFTDAASAGPIGSVAVDLNREGQQ